ncbi:DNA-binding transcriptional LysR family regulator [Actinokineospora baliensis]|uniref:LysR family transcriptional regulator n=1 Tax=Actinokineospora baliensis TaxID=547056 RepID=UPI001959AC95|nr:LysR family transcriptional regulator [Actinokineospora baliensis]MBM7776141.1 DNA-binding transcriptional LysR family regulator [Actinokineospora baliensis]
MDVRDLECFLAVAEEGTISRAAERLHMTQPPLTVRVRALERELGVELLVRHGRGVTVTAAGRLLADHARRLLADLTATTETVRAVGLGTRGRLALAIGHSIAPRLLARLLRSVGSDVDVALVEVSDAEVLDRVHHREAHAGLLSQSRSTPRRAAGLEVAVVGRSPLVVVLPQTHPCADAERVDLADLPDDRVVVPDLAELTPTAATRHRADSVAHALALVQAGMGVVVLTAEHAPQVWPGLVARPLRQHTEIIEAAVCWRPDEHSPVMRRFLRAALATPEPDALGHPFARPHPADDS